MTRRRKAGRVSRASVKEGGASQGRRWELPILGRSRQQGRRRPVTRLGLPVLNKCWGTLHKKNLKKSTTRRQKRDSGGGWRTAGYLGKLDSPAQETKKEHKGRVLPLATRAKPDGSRNRSRRGGGLGWESQAACRCIIRRACCLRS